jgi:SAM-dependent methyltransferase
LPIDRHYIGQFLSDHARDIGGHVLEIKDNAYTLRYGGDRVTKTDVLHKVEGNPEASIVADLSCANELDSDIFDCIICTQTLQFIYDVQAAVETLHRILKPGAVLLVTVPGISPISRYDMEHWGDYWRFTSLSARLLLEETFASENVTVRAYGSSLTAVAFLQGIASGELKPEELDYTDPDYEVLVAARAVKAKAI